MRAIQWVALLSMVSMVISMSACSRGGQQVAHPPSSPLAYASANMFPYQGGWLGADDAYSVSLGNDKSLWFFGDTFIGPSGATNRTQVTGFIHNSVGISTCAAQGCTFSYFWNGMGGSHPRPVFAAPGGDWFWPLDAFIYHGTLYVALTRMYAAGRGTFGFATAASELASVSNYTQPPTQWNIRYQTLNTGGGVVPGVSIVVGRGPGGNPDPAAPGGANYAYFFTDTANSSSMALLRVPLADLNQLARPGSAPWEYLTAGGAWAKWSSTAATLPSDAAQVIRPGATEMTVRYHSSTRQWIAVYPVGLANSAHYSLSSSLTGGWGPSQVLYKYPEMQTSNPNYTPHVFCYAAKEHVEFEAPGELAFTYVCNSTVASDVTNNMNLYHPIMVIQKMPK